MKEKRKPTYWFMLALLAMLSMTSSSFGGNLEPSAPPGATMKTLDEVEPRIPISSAPYTISSPGSYYVTSDLKTIFGAGIIVSADNVTIDLMGYSLIGMGSGGGYGIYMDGRSNVEIRNGTVRNFGGAGIYEGNSSSKGHRIIGVRAVSNGDSGINLEGHGHLVKDCTAVDNQGNDGIYAGYGSVVTGNTASFNRFGIRAVNSTMTGNVAYRNQGYGIYCPYCTITGNTANFNEGTGIFTSAGSTVDGNTANENNQSGSEYFAGISAGDENTVKGNTAKGNNQYNIRVYGTDNAIEENLVTNSLGYGIYFADEGNLYANNRASGNTTNYGNTAGNTSGGGNYSF